MADRFPAGTFTPRPQPASLPRMLAAQTRLELTLLLRNGEQLLLTMFIPITLLIGLCLLPIGTSAGDTTAARAASFVPAILAVSIMSTAFTGQAIAVGFDRRYGALKRLGATPIPRWGIIAGKTFAVILVVALQALIIGGIGLAFGWRPDPSGLAIGAVVIALGTAAFAALGLLLGGTLKAEVVLALGNLIWFVLLAFSGLVVFDEHLPDAAGLLVGWSPSGALTEALIHAVSDNSFDVGSVVVLLLWAVAGGLLAIRWFKFE
ncbi:ABC transporter permease [Gordonia phosphorivorans]|uniref:ABC transporter permease n=1 Tax=Gordonia phosphorivorans TaxID=1056982 RepID=A0ABV6H9I5_9ACTN